MNNQEYEENVKQNKKVIISIVIPVYNVEAYLERCIESIINQTYPLWELILIDDGSNDKSGEICDKYSQEYSNISVIHQKNQGVSTARNAGIRFAKGEYCLFIDSDDWIDENMLKLLMLSSKGADLIVCDAFDVYVDGKEIIEPRNTWDNNSSFRADKYYDVICKSGTLWNKLIRRDVMKNNRFVEGMTYGEDVVFLARILPFVNDTVIVPTPLYYYFQNRPGNVVSAIIDERTYEYLDNAFIVYKELSKQNKAGCGVYRIYTTVLDVFRKISQFDKKRYKKLISKCGAVLRETTLKDRREYLKDKAFCTTIKNKILFIVLCYFPNTAFLIMKRTKRV